MTGLATINSAEIPCLADDLRSAHGAYLVLNPDFTIVGASDEYLQVTLLGRSDITGCNVFDVFPDNPTHEDANSVSHLRASFEEVLRRGEPAEMPVLRYDVRDRVSGSGRWIEKHWLPVNLPVFGSGSSEIVYLIHHARDVTEAVIVKDWIEERELVIEEHLATLEEMKQSLLEKRARLAAGRVDLLRAMSSANSRERMAGVRADVDCPDLRRYYVPRDSVQVSGIYRLHHLRGCQSASEWLHLETGSRFPFCPSCRDCLLYSLTTAM
jgi:PAS fold